jgi:hypothetical protein
LKVTQIGNFDETYRNVTNGSEKLELSSTKQPSDLEDTIKQCYKKTQYIKRYHEKKYSYTFYLTLGQGKGQLKLS